MKKTLLTTAAIALLSAGVMAQGTNKQGGVSQKRNFSAAELKTTSNNNGGIKYNRCGTAKPSEEWDTEFNKQVEAYRLEHANEIANGKTASTTYTLPIIFHIIHGGQAVGTFPNIAAAQVNSQITVLNQDYAGTGYQSSTYPAGAFSGYASATSNSVAVASKDGTGRVAIANTGISFCAATKDPNGVTLVEPGIDRISYVTKGWTNPATLTSSNFQSYIDATIKPGSIWDVTKYFNVWLTDEDMTSANSPGLLGYSTFPASSTNTGLSAPYGTATTDGCWFYSKVCGSAAIYAAGTYDPTYKYGRTICHECGHYLGLRHPWGDNGQCGGTDYCNDTPPEKGQGTNQPYGCWYGTNTYPVNAGTCTYGGQTNTNGDMFMNIMDYTDDVAMYMFTNDQAIRMQTSMANSPNRKLLTASATNLCAGVTAVAPVAGFTYPGTICTGQPYTFTDASSNSPTSYTWTANSSTGVVITSTNSASPAISFSNTGTYTITQTVSNSAGSNSASHTITSTTCVPTCDTMHNVITADLATPHIYWADAVAPRDSGYALGTNAYLDKAKAEKYTYANNGKQIKAIRVYIHKAGTGNVTFNVWNDNATPGTPGTVLASKTVGLGTLVNGYNTITLTTPVTPGSIFYVGFNIPTTTGDTIAVACNDGTNGVANMGFEEWSNSTWNAYSAATVYNTNLNNFMFPIMCPPSGTTGIEHNELGSAINLFPNPNNGQFNFSVNLPEAANLNFTIVNMIGQVVYTKSENNITNAVLSCDLSHLSKGVYYANITDGKNNKTVKKIIIE
ncbi:MAG: T9SS type A sorting domain-containing protein [Bacteroidia bacterium]